MIAVSPWVSRKVSRETALVPFAFGLLLLAFLFGKIMGNAGYQKDGRVSEGATDKAPAARAALQPCRDVRTMRVHVSQKRRLRASSHDALFSMLLGLPVLQAENPMLNRRAMLAMMFAAEISKSN